MFFSNSGRRIERYPRSNVIHAPSSHFKSYVVYPMRNYGRACFMNFLNADEDYQMKGDSNV